MCRRTLAQSDEVAKSTWHVIYGAVQIHHGNAENAAPESDGQNGTDSSDWTTRIWIVRE